MKNSKDTNVYLTAYTALVGIGPASNDAVPALTEALKDDDVDVRHSAVFALGRIGPASNDAVPALSEALKDPEARVSSAAERAPGEHQQVEDESRRRMTMKLSKRQADPAEFRRTQSAWK